MNVRLTKSGGYVCVAFIFHRLRKCDKWGESALYSFILWFPIHPPFIYFIHAALFFPADKKEGAIDLQRRVTYENCTTSFWIANSHLCKRVHPSDHLSVCPSAWPLAFSMDTFWSYIDPFRTPAEGVDWNLRLLCFLNILSVERFILNANGRTNWRTDGWTDLLILNETVKKREREWAQ